MNQYRDRYNIRLPRGGTKTLTPEKTIQEIARWLVIGKTLRIRTFDGKKTSKQHGAEVLNCARALIERERLERDVLKRRIAP